MDFAVKRKIDKLGRIVIPKDFRKALGVDIDSEVIIRLIDGVVTVRADTNNKIEEGSDGRA